VDSIEDAHEDVLLQCPSVVQVRCGGRVLEPSQRERVEFDQLAFELSVLEK